MKYKPRFNHDLYIETHDFINHNIETHDFINYNLTYLKCINCNIIAVKSTRDANEAYYYEYFIVDLTCNEIVMKDILK